MQHPIPDVIGRMPDDDDMLDERASTESAASVTVPYEGAAIGSVTVQVFKSVDQEDRGGVVFRITGKDEASSFIPHCVQLPDGLEVHLAGDIEGKSLIRALRSALAQLPL